MMKKASLLNPKTDLLDDEAHPASDSALNYVCSLGYNKLMLWLESFASLAIENNRLAEICHETLRRILNHEPVSDRYLLGLAWTLKELEDAEMFESA